jgi:uracil phosphoribosyltransferase
MSRIRDKTVTVEEYVRSVDRMCDLLAAEGLAHLPCEEIAVETHCGTYAGLRGPAASDVCAVSVMRSGDILLDAVKRARVGISVGKILIQRDEDDPEKRPKLYYSKLPEDIKDKHVVLCDPMLATGGSACCAIKVMLEAGVPEERIMFLNCVGCPEGIAMLSEKYPKVKVLCAEMDEHLNDDKYIVPGLGDFGDRYYMT